MRYKNKLMGMLAGIMAISFAIVACSSGNSDGGSQPVGYKLGTLPNGSVVYANESSLTAKSDESTIAHVAIVGGTVGAEYVLYVGNVNPAGPDVKMTPNSYCIVVAGSVESSGCDVVFNGNDSAVGDYIVTFDYAPNVANPATIQPTGVGESLPNSLLFRVTQGEEKGYKLGTLPNGSRVYVNESSFTAKSDESTTGHVRIVGGTLGAEYILYVGNVNPVGPDISMSPRAYCLVVAGSTESSGCDIAFNGNDSESGNYMVTFDYAPNANSPANIQPTGIGQSLPNLVQFIVTPGEEKSLLIFTTTELTNGVLGGVAGADTKCQTAATVKNLTGTYKAMLVGEDEPAPRRACSTPNCEGVGELGSSDWVLSANQSYKNEEGTKIGKTNSHAIFTFPVDNAINSNGINKVWTGLAKDWQTQAGCTNWTSTTVVFNNMTLPGNGYIGQENMTVDTMISDSLGQNCADNAVLYCVEQK